MQNLRSLTLQRILGLLAGLLIIKVTVAVLWGYRNYFPANFESDFLRGREQYFSGPYQWAFYTHIASGPGSLFLGLILISDRFRRQFPKWHRYLGRVQVASIVLLITPSGLWMAYYAAAGPMAAIGFALLSVMTAACALLGWRTAVQRRFAEHRRWMWRCFLLLCSAVVIRVLGGLGTVLGVESEWFDPLAGWASWLLPLTVFEIRTLVGRRRIESRALVMPAQQR